MWYRAGHAITRGDHVGKGQHRGTSVAEFVGGTKRRGAISMTRQEKDFLVGFGLAATLTRHLIGHRPSYTTAEQYAQDVAHLHADSDDFVSRGIAVGCLSAFGRR